jgi:orotidine-5'-phosphate decarboxylase
MSEAREKLIVALDVPSVDEAKALIETLGDSVGVYKIGLELLFSGGFDLARALARQGRSVFVDAKLLDIDATVERATAVIAESGAAFLTVHAMDRKTVASAVRGRGDAKLKLLGVTVLTNLSRADLAEHGIDEAPLAVVQRRAMMARDGGFDGIIASGQEARALRERLRQVLIVTGHPPRRCREAGPDARRDAQSRDQGRRRLSRRRPPYHTRCRPVCRR